MVGRLARSDTNLVRPTRGTRSLFECPYLPPDSCEYETLHDINRNMSSAPYYSGYYYYRYYYTTHTFSKVLEVCVEQHCQKQVLI